MALWTVEMTDSVVAGREIPQNQLETVLVLYPDSSASPRDFPLSDAVEISRLRFTALEMTGGVVSVEMIDGVVAGREIPQNQLETVLVLYPDSSASPRDFPLSDAVEISRLRFTSLEMTDGVVSSDMTDGAVSLEMTDGVGSGDMSDGVGSSDMSDGVGSSDMSDGGVSLEND